MTVRAPEFLAGLLDLARVSRFRFDEALARACPAILRWCERDDVPVSRAALCEAVIAALPQALQQTWPECLARSRSSARAASQAQAEFLPRVDVFGGPAGWVVVPLSVGVSLTRYGPSTNERPVCMHTTISLAVDGVASGRVAFHSIERDLVLAPGIWG